MAEKEEKIYVYRFTDDDGICPLEEICTEFPGQCGHCKEIPTRTEVIKKMSDAIAAPYFEGVFSCENEAIEEYAKAALNALLGDK